MNEWERVQGTQLLLLSPPDSRNQWKIFSHRKYGGSIYSFWISVLVFRCDFVCGHRVGTQGGKYEKEIGNITTLGNNSLNNGLASKGRRRYKQSVCVRSSEEAPSK